MRISGIENEVVYIDMFDGRVCDDLGNEYGIPLF